MVVMRGCWFAGRWMKDLLKEEDEEEGEGEREGEREEEEEEEEEARAREDPHRERTTLDRLGSRASIQKSAFPTVSSFERREDDEETRSRRNVEIETIMSRIEVSESITVEGYKADKSSVKKESSSLANGRKPFGNVSSDEK
ncbi:hypothetical protein HZH68_001393 [Vespula germanica]|uniref:Uncharacterized protein n=1 Tax=Vespula germanica TaxID=30212 RepID=A0A834U6Y7_VESGE|nr:hypothetical protein HZH68_001393 [Vespula germanica]